MKGIGHALLAEYEPEAHDIDLGGGHWLSPFVQSDSDEVAGYFDIHPYQGQPERACVGSVNRPGHGHGNAEWDVLSENPLTLSPSLLCRTCGNHGFVREGKWVPA